MRPPLRIGLALVALAGAGAALHAQPSPSAGVWRDGDAIVFSGRIDGPSVREFLRLLDDPAVTRLVIRSPGGLVAPALDMAEALHARGLDVEVAQACLSSCANYVFPAGRRKLLSGPEAVGWHGNMAHVIYRQLRGEEQWSEDMMSQARELAPREEAFFRSVGVDGFICWFGKIPPYYEDDFYALSVADMRRFGITDVTVVNPAAPLPTGVRMLTVDFATLEAGRPPQRRE